VRTADVLPTVARLAGARPRWRMQGHSVYGRPARRIPSSTTVFQRSGRRFTFTLAALRRWARSARLRKVALFGSGAAQPGLYGIGPYRGLVGDTTSSLRVAAAGATRAALTGRRAFDAVRFTSSFIPAYVSGRILRAGAHPPRAVAVAVNGRIATTSPTYRVHRGGPLYFGALMPEPALKEGRNDVRVYAVSGPAGSPRLRAI
jgi:hypothetical protein